MKVRLGSELKQRLGRLAEATKRPKVHLAAEVIRDFVDLNEWQTQETRNANAWGRTARPGAG